MRISIAGVMAASALSFFSTGSAKAQFLDLGIIVDSGTVQPVGDPNYIYTFQVEFKPSPTLHDFIQNGDSFTIFLTGNTGVLSGTNDQPPVWSAGSFTGGSLTWTYIGGGMITTAMPLDPPPGPFFQVVSTQLTSGTFTYTFKDSIPGSPGGNTGSGSFTVTVVPEPSSAILCGLGVPVVYFAARLRRRAARH
jgi:hypothetical protein